MGRRRRSLITTPSLFFVTSTLRNREPPFSNPDLLAKVERQLMALFPTYAGALLGYVLMPSHVHLLIGCSSGAQLSRFKQTFKSLTARELFPGQGSVWVPRFDDLVIASEKQFWVKLNYIHENPVRKKLVPLATDWHWSSARFWMLNEPNGALTREWDWSW